MTLQALLWDVDGTLAETERDGHRLAFNRAFEALGLPWRWDVQRYGELLAVTGGRERLLHDMASRADAPADREALALELHGLKNRFYAEIVAAGGIALRGGVAGLLREAREAGVLQAIVTTTSRDNVGALLQAALGGDWRSWFAAIVCGEDVAAKKPSPEAHRIALAELARLGIEPRHALAIEDSPAGVAAARAAGVPVIVTRSIYFAAFDGAGAVAVVPSLDGITLADLGAWHR